MNRRCHFLLPCQGKGPGDRLFHALSLQRGNFHHIAAQLPGQFIHIYGIPGFFHNIHHVHCHDHRYAKLQNLGGEIKVSLNIGAVHNIDNGIRPFMNQIIPCHHLFRCVRRQGIDSRQIRDDHIFGTYVRVLLFQFPFLFFHRHSGPVAHELTGAGQSIK